VISVVIPAHNEASTIARTLGALNSESRGSEIDITLVANGCSDDTVAAARAAFPDIRVVETPIPSKANALNLGDRHSTGFPRAYLDADIELSPGALPQMASEMTACGALAAAPAMRMRFLDAPWTVRAYYRVWQQLPYVQEGMIGVGVYMLSETGRARFDQFPDIIADDGYVRRLFKPHERISVGGCHSTVTAPQTLWGLVKIKTRSRLGGYELARRFPELSENEPKDYRKAIYSLFGAPTIWPALIVYFGVNFAARFRARRMLRQRQFKVWERDDSSRQ
jgi:glycosyltransferase involved in cell wall biosynthesis